MELLDVLDVLDVLVLAVEASVAFSGVIATFQLGGGKKGYPGFCIRSAASLVAYNLDWTQHDE
ncbi:hypothetical protein ACMAY9_00510 [Porticoccaceae bacterium nBUS_09]